MGLCWWLTVGFAAYVISFLIDANVFSPIYNHLPGNCTIFRMNGSEDFVLYPNNHVLISSGIFLYELQDERYKPPPGIFLLDLNLDSPYPVNLNLEGFPDSQIPSEFAPHGMGHWITEDGSMLLYVINHRKSSDTVESFVYISSEKILLHRKTFSDPLFHNLNDLVVVGKDEFYVTVDRYFKKSLLRSIEVYSRIALAYVLYFNTTGAIIASERLKYPNGITKSNDGRFLFVNELLKGQVVAYTRNEDHTLQQVQVLPLELAPDNIFVDPKTGHLWIGIITQPLKVAQYFLNQTVAVGSRVLHVAIDQKKELPFENYLIEEVFSSTGKDGVVGAVTGCVYSEGRLVLGTIAKDMMLCDVPYVMYKN